MRTMYRAIQNRVAATENTRPLKTPSQGDRPNVGFKQRCARRPRPWRSVPKSTHYKTIPWRYWVCPQSKHAVRRSRDRYLETVISRPDACRWDTAHVVILSMKSVGPDGTANMADMKRNCKLHPSPQLSIAGVVISLHSLRICEFVCRFTQQTAIAACLPQYTRTINNVVLSQLV